MNEADTLQFLENLFASKPLTKLQKIIFQHSLQGQSYLEIANNFDYDYGYVKDTGAELWQRLTVALGQKVTKQNFQLVFTHCAQNQNPNSTTQDLSITPHRKRLEDWGQAVDASVFYGRSPEIAVLKSLIVEQQCRIIAVLGMGGLGKTALTVNVATAVADKFDYLFWWSLRDAPPVDKLLTRLIRFLDNPQTAPLPDHEVDQLVRLVELMQQKRCLLILDNFEGILHSSFGDYREGCAGYGTLLQRLGELNHPSCVLITSREKPKEVSLLEGPSFPVQSVSLQGLDAEAGRSLLSAKGLVSLPEAADQLVERYQGNPLALKIMATGIQDLFGGNIASFLAQDVTLFNGITQLLSQQVHRLSETELHVMYWLAVNREPLTLIDLHRSLIPLIFKSQLAETLESLRWRSLIECSSYGFTLQPVVMEFMTSRLIEQVADEIVTFTPKQLDQVALLHAIAKDYIRDSQERLILDPLVQYLLGQFGTHDAISTHLYQGLQAWRDQAKTLFGYTTGNLLNLWRHLGTDLTGYDLSKLNIRQAYLPDVSLHHVDCTQAEFSECVFAETFGGVTALAFSHDGQLLASSDTNGDIQIWNVQTSQVVTRCQGHNNWVWAVGFSPNRRLLASCGQDGTIRLWDTQTGTGLNVLSGHSSIVTGIAFSPSGQQLASSSYDHSIKLWDVTTGHCLQTLQGHQGCVWSVCFTANGQFLVSCGEDQTLKIWDISDPPGDPVCTTIAAHQGWVKSVAVHGNLIASASFDQTIKLWDLETGTGLHTLRGHIAPVVGVTLSADGKTVASASYDQTVKVWDATTGECLKTLEKHTNRIWTVAFHPDAQILASGGDDNRTILWDVTTGQTIKTRQGHSNCIYAIARSPQNSAIATSHEDQTVKIWNVERCILPYSGQTTTVVAKPTQILRGHTGRVLSLAYHPQGKILASSCTSRMIRLWDVQSGRCLQVLYGHASWIWAIAFSADGNWLGSASYDRTVRVWNPKTAECVQVLQGHTSSVLSVAFDPTNRLLASVGYEKEIKIWDIQTGECLKAWHGHENRVWAVTFINASLLATGGDGKAIHIWDIQTGECLQTLLGHAQDVLSLSYHAPTHTLISTSMDQTLKVWDIETGECLQTLDDHQNWVWSSAIAPDHNLLFSCSQDETIKWWDLKTSECLGTLRSPRPYEGLKITKARGFTEAQQTTLLALGAIAEML